MIGSKALEIGSLCRFRHRGKGWLKRLQRHERGSFVSFVSIDSNDLFVFLGTELVSRNPKMGVGVVHKILHPDHGILICTERTANNLFERINEDE